MWAAVGITSWADFAAFMAAMYSLLLVCEFVWKKMLKPGIGWWKARKGREMGLLSAIQDEQFWRDVCQNGRSLLQGANNAVASNITGPVDLINAGIGLPVVFPCRARTCRRRGMGKKKASPLRPHAAGSR